MKAKLVLTIALVLCSANASFAGNEEPASTPKKDSHSQGQEGKGGFAPDNAKQLLDETRVELVDILKYTPEREFSSLPKPIDKAEFIRIVDQVRSDFTHEIERPVNGAPEPLSFDYGTDPDGTKYIVAMKPFFLGFMGAPDTGEEHYLIAKDLLHEASHHFNYSESEANEFAPRLIRNILVKYFGAHFASNGSHSRRRFRRS